MRLGLETFSYHLAFASGKMDIFGFIERTHALGLDGVQINVRVPDWGHLGGADPGHLREVRSMTEDLGMFVEMDTRGIDPKHLADALEVCAAIGGDVVRTHLDVHDDLAWKLRHAPAQLRKMAPLCENLGVRIALENHEYATAREIVGVVREADSERIGVHVDTGNSMMAWEDPVEAVRAMAPHAVSSHFKDHVVIMEEGEPLVVGVPLGRGTIDCAECFRILAAESPLERVNIEVCYGYSAPFRRSQEEGAGAQLGQGPFVLQEPPFDPPCIAPHPYRASKADRGQFIEWQDRAVIESVAFVRQLNERFG